MVVAGLEEKSITRESDSGAALEIIYVSLKMRLEAPL
jgi:hypothetical protein